MSRWNIGLPGGPAGPFYSVVKQNGNVIAMQIPDKEKAQLIAKLGEILDRDFGVVRETRNRLSDILERDFPNGNYPIVNGGLDYTIKAVIEALFWEHIPE